jgi:hypothetical protein
MSPATPSLAAARRPGRPGSHVIVLFGATPRPGQAEVAPRAVRPGRGRPAARALPHRGTARSNDLSEARLTPTARRNEITIDLAGQGSISARAPYRWHLPEED